VRVTPEGDRLPTIAWRRDYRGKNVELRGTVHDVRIGSVERHFNVTLELNRVSAHDDELFITCLMTSAQLERALALRRGDDATAVGVLSGEHNPVLYGCVVQPATR
jgi:hypothetical protein